MRTTCPCETRPPAAATGCHECGTPTCPSCALTVGPATFCRWCAPALARVA